MIFPQKLDMHGRSDIADVRRMTERYINDMQRLIEANDSNLRKRLAALEKADAAAAEALRQSMAGISDAEAETASGLVLLAGAVSDIEAALSAAGPILIEQPADQSVPAHTAVTFSVRALGVATYKWQHLYSSDWIDCNWDGKDTASMTVSASSVTNLMNGRRFRCILTGSGWTIYTRQAILTVT